MSNSRGKIIIRAGASVWPHELKTAEALSAAGYTVEFIPKSEVDCKKTPDVLLNGFEWEMKSPVSGNLSNIQKPFAKPLTKLHESSTIRNALRTLPTSKSSVSCASKHRCSDLSRV